MSKHDYTPAQALERLIAKITSSDAGLAAEVRAAVNAGRDVQETEQVRRRGRVTSQSFRRTLPFSSQQALEVALKTLNAHFIEQPLFHNSVLDEVAQVSLGVVEPTPRQSWSKEQLVKLEGKGDQKTVEIELHTETQLLRDTESTQREPDTVVILRVPAELIEEQKTNVLILQNLFNFTEEQ
jgi:hypothetical protein